MKQPAAKPVPPDSSNQKPLLPELVELTLQACDVAQQAVAYAIHGLLSNTPEMFAEAEKCEQELDSLDRELDEAVSHAVGVVPPEQRRDLLSCVKLMTDLERIGDLMAIFAGRARAVGRHLDAQDVRQLAEMAARLKEMLVGARQSYVTRNLNMAIAVLKADAEVDRLRNLLFHRHLEEERGAAAGESIQVLFMTQLLERAGDHAKNLAEEICHLVSGHTLRHVLRSNGKSREQMLLDWLKRHHALDE
ncbi:MAG: phosphate signaling complex PhoU family protein [Terriglobales bacterium]